MTRVLGDTERRFGLDSILTSIKKLLGINESYDCFDADIIMYINSAFVTLSQIGVSEADEFSIEDDSKTWDDFIDDNIIVGMIKTYIYSKVKIMFDPPTSSIVMEALNKSIMESEWRIQAAVSSSSYNTSSNASTN